MSYDVSLVINTGYEDRTVVDIGNYTSNVASMWNKALGYEFSELDGENCGNCLDDLRRAVNDMESNPIEYRKMNPANGWGDYEGALDFLDKLKRECARNPKAKIDMWY